MADFDDVIIGSGIGGLTAALALAQAGDRVLVLEQHYVPGGWCHSFTIGGHRFSPGVHYVGELAEGARTRQVLEGLGIGGELVFLELNPDGFDHLLIGGERFDIPKGKQRLAERLSARFPAEARGIARYLDGVERMSHELATCLDTSGPFGVVALPFRAPNVALHGLEKLDHYLDRFVSKNPLLRAILTMQCGDHGMPPSIAPAAVHAGVVSHYFGGGYYPRGGGFAIPRAFLRGLKRAGGELELSAEVEQILLEDGRAIGVRLAGGREVRARRVISNADPGVTFGRLVPEEHVSRRLRAHLARSRWSISAISLFMATDLDLGALGFDSGNYWYAATPEVEDCYALGIARDSLPGLFLTITTLKDPSKMHGGLHTIEAFSFVGHEAFRAWAGSRFGERPSSYEALKEELLAKLLRAASRIVPGLEAHVAVAEIGTPLTNRHYVAATEGCLYGTEKSRWQVGPFAWPARTPIQGLWLCGASTTSHGVLGAATSGLNAVAEILHCRPDALLTQKGGVIELYPSDDPSAWPARLQGRLRRVA